MLTDVQFSEPFELGFRAGYWGRDFNPYQDELKRQAFDFGKEMGEYAATMPGTKSRKHFHVARFFILSLLCEFLGNSREAHLN